ncbi:UDP-glucuronate:xylan alpha-glucuronosyltransferase [Thalictrum thalictroides]|uniref:Hexosyltransferase n=1 Tax=Thalictrum thalictroides TaxID=46969 RepID=A0A7J6WUZ1_THATH|nr:UDP-glucuronate:xylan alpha-glucuronosyltransferase [Thalictrum thalictroides]
MMKITSSKALVIRINLAFLVFFLVLYACLLLQPSSSPYFEKPTLFVRCSLRECHHKKVDERLAMKTGLEENVMQQKRTLLKREMPSFLNATGKKLRIGTVNMENEDLSEWNFLGDIRPIHFERVSKNLVWSDLFPEWIDEEEEDDIPVCPEIPMSDYTSYGELDFVVAKLPCRYPKQGWARDVFRLQVHLISANLLVKNGKRYERGRTQVIFLSTCRPMLDMFRADDFIEREADWWWYQPEMNRLEQKVSLPVGSCKLSLPLWGEGNDEVYDISKMKMQPGTIKREAYATVLHSSESYVCGAITLAQSIIKTGTKRDLIMLLDNSISQSKREALAAAGWKIRVIKRIRNPKAEKNSYNEYNYSKFRLWQLTDYDKIIFIDADIVVLRNLDILFNFPQMSATGNDNSIFNSGIMTLEPSNCTFKILMEQRKEIVSYNGGDQGFLNEVFVWWHRFPRRVNYLKNFWANTTLEASVKNQLFGADPPQLYSIHFLGLKPWHCYRDYDCNWDLSEQRVYASDIAHQRWWKLHDSMDKNLQQLCGLTEQRKIELAWDRKQAKKMGSPDQHWKIKVSDPRRHID